VHLEKVGTWRESSHSVSVRNPIVNQDPVSRESLRLHLEPVNTNKSILILTCKACILQTMNNNQKKVSRCHCTSLTPLLCPSGEGKSIVTWHCRWKRTHAAVSILRSGDLPDATGIPAGILIKMQTHYPKVRIKKKTAPYKRNTTQYSRCYGTSTIAFWMAPGYHYISSAAS